nr:AraC family transcriptional regulator [uncultured Carboxylicivirga sp.]
MKNSLHLPYKGDPSDILQYFPKYNLQIHCCRYWWLERWQYRELSFPYWRIYYNNKKGAFITSGDKTIELLPNKIYLIAPNTSYSTHLFNHKIPIKGYDLKGGRITSEYRSTNPNTSLFIEHLYIHFNIGFPYDNISPSILTFDISTHLMNKINAITKHLGIDNKEFSFSTLLTIQSLIIDLLAEVNTKQWELPTGNHHILESLNFIENNIHNQLSNRTLSEKCRLATNTFTRLFKQETGMSPQNYVRQKRIDTACILLHHSDESIDEIATKTGFTNRYHFTRIFKQVTGISPAKYRKEFKIN